MATRVLIVADTHFRFPPVPDDGMWWNRMLQSRTVGLADALVRLAESVEPDLVLHAGDITDQGDHPSHEFALRTFERLGCPVVATPGNHDTFEPGTRERFGRAYGGSAGTWSHATDVAGVRVLVLDSAWWFWADAPPTECIDWDRHKAGTCRGIGASDADLAWLDAELARGRDMPLVVVTHPPMHSKPIVPPEPIHHPPGMKPPLNEYGTRNDDVLAVIAKHDSPDVVVAGHWHYHDLTASNGTLNCTTAALVEYPCEARVMEIGGGRVSIRTIGLDDPSFAEQSFVAEWDHRWPAGATDDDRTGAYPIGHGAEGSPQV